MEIPKSPTTSATSPAGHRTRALRLLAEFAGEAVAEFALQALSCLLLAGLGAALWWLWSRSPALAVGTGAALLSTAVGAVAARRRGPWSTARVAVATIIVLLALAVWFLGYGLQCQCLQG